MASECKEQTAAKSHQRRKVAIANKLPLPALGASSNYYIKTKIAKDPRGTPRIPPNRATGKSHHTHPKYQDRIQPKKGTPQGCRPNITSKDANILGPRHMEATNAHKPHNQQRWEPQCNVKSITGASG
ncbi:hypothetical protein Nepgr_004073 [Nepenthes gracilis]|uniref:Uncharacterized protein n=1 Tax=Nepenthes gracilis TaxID=150966 RepID=A0AAD3XEL0_NEPGR|nr:hypothetical protein Nepgr_004073 [Nepenthes gracilis]